MVTFNQRHSTEEKAQRRINRWREKQRQRQQNKVVDLVTPFHSHSDDVYICQFCDVKLEPFTDPLHPTTGQLYTCLKCGYVYDTALENENIKIEDEIGTVVKADSINPVLEFIDTSGAKNQPDRQIPDIEPEFEEWLESQGYEVIDTKVSIPGGFVKR